MLGSRSRDMTSRRVLGDSVVSLDEDAEGAELDDQQQDLQQADAILSQSFASSSGMTELSSLYSMSEDVRYTY